MRVFKHRPALLLFVGLGVMVSSGKAIGKEKMNSSHRYVTSNSSVHNELENYSLIGQVQQMKTGAPGTDKRKVYFYAVVAIETITQGDPNHIYEPYRKKFPYFFVSGIEGKEMNEPEEFKLVSTLEVGKKYVFSVDLPTILETDTSLDLGNDNFPLELLKFFPKIEKQGGLRSTQIYDVKPVE